MKKTQVLITSVLFLMILLVPSCSTKKNTVKDALKKIPVEEQQKLSEFFEELIVNQLFGYTIFGGKPFTETHVFTTPNTDELTLKQNSNLIMKSGVAIWEKYKDLFPSKKFVLKYENNDNGGSLFIINIPYFKSNVNKHINLFKDILGENMTADSLLEMIVKQDLSYHNTLQYNQTLIGILYGFGEHNSLLFDRYILLGNELTKNTSPPLANLSVAESQTYPLSEFMTQTCGDCSNNKKNNSRKIVPSVGFKDIKEEYIYIETKLRSLHALFQPTPLEHIQLPCFRIDPTNQESKQIIQGLMETRKKLSKIYFSGELLEATLKKLTE